MAQIVGVANEGGGKTETDAERNARLQAEFNKKLAAITYAPKSVETSSPSTPQVYNVQSVQTSQPYQGGGENVYYGGENLNVNPLTDYVSNLTDPIAAQYMDLYGVPYNPYTGPNDPFNESQDAAAVAQQQYLSGETTNQERQFSQFQGSQFYQGGSEQAALGVYNQQLANLGVLTPEELGFMGLTPTNQMSPVLSPADVRRLTSDDPALSTYANDLKTIYGDDWFEQLYKVDPDTGWAELVSYTSPDDGIGGWGGYGSGYGGGSGGGYGSTYRAAQRNGLITWRIGL